MRYLLIREYNEVTHDPSPGWNDRMHSIAREVLVTDEPVERCSLHRTWWIRERQCSRLFIKRSI